jgi:hypothetical protein
MTTLFLVWRQPGQRWWPVGRLTRSHDLYAFVYVGGARLANEQVGFAPLISFPDFDQVYFSRELFPLFQNRLFAKGRSEARDLIVWADLPPGEQDPLVVLGRTRGPRVTDMFEVFPKPLPDAGRYDALFFAHGLAHRSPPERAAALHLQPGERLAPRAEPENPEDDQAVAIHTHAGVQIGYLPRYLCADFTQLTQACPGDVELRVRRVNPTAPLQFQVLAELRACWPADFAPCTGAEYRPLRADADAVIARPAARLVHG